MRLIYNKNIIITEIGDSLPAFKKIFVNFTGDIIKIDNNGFVYMLDRKKDMILVSGFNVYPNEIEAVIAAHPGVLEVGVVGEPHDLAGEIVKAVIVKKNPHLTAADINIFCRIQLTG